MAPVALSSIRQQVTPEALEAGFEALRDKVNYRLKQKGDGSYASTHEIYGILAEEVKEVLDELQANDNSLFAKELLDVAVAALWGYICVSYGYI